MGLKQYFEFKGVKYGIGTVVKIPRFDDWRWIPREELIEEAVFVGGGYFKFKESNYSAFLPHLDDRFTGKYADYIEIIEPVYYQEPEPPKKQNIFLRTKSGSWEAHNHVCVGLTLYIIVMVLACFLKSPAAIWVLATIIYFSWKANK